MPTPTQEDVKAKDFLRRANFVRRAEQLGYLPAIQISNEDRLQPLLNAKMQMVYMLQTQYEFVLKDMRSGEVFPLTNPPLEFKNAFIRLTQEQSP